MDSPWFSIAFGVAAFLFYALNMPVVTVGIFLVCGTLICLFCEDTRAGLTLVLLVLFSFRYKDNLQAYFTKSAIKLYVVAMPCFFASMLYRLIRRRVPFGSRFGLLGIGLFCSAMLLGGVFTEYYTFIGFTRVLVLSAALFCAYAFFAFTLQKREDNLLYLARVLAVGICVIALEVLEYYVRNYTWGTPLNAEWKDMMYFGWSISNMVAEMMVFGLPAVFYLIYKEEHGYWYWSIVVLALGALYFTFARNAMLGAAATLLVGTLINCFCGKNKRINLILVCSALLVGIALVLAMYQAGYLTELADFFLDVGLGDRGRFRIWEKHFELFKEYPVLGVGFDAYGQFWAGVSRAHNNLVQMIASTGVVGFTMYLFHRLQTIGMILKKPTVERILMGGCIGVSLMMGMLSSTFFHAYSLVHYGVILLVLEKSAEK